jgi:putative Ca2+/H+ antiporter (TMEM165/GDT1 family)
VDWRVVAAAFSAIFLAEMGDKTQLAAMTMAASSGFPLSVFVGAAAALTAVSAIGVMVGGALGTYLPVEWIKRAAGVAFVAIGVLMLAGKL